MAARTAGRVQFAEPQAGQVFAAIAHDVTVPKIKVTRRHASGSPAGAHHQPVQRQGRDLNGSGVAGLADQAAAGLTSRGFDVTGTGNAASFAYTNSVIEYASPADMAAVNTLKQELTNVTELQDPTLTPGTVELILGSDFTGLVPQSPAALSATPGTPATQRSHPARRPRSAAPERSATASGSASPSASASGISNLAQANGSITAAASCASDASAFAGGVLAS